MSNKKFCFVSDFGIQHTPGGAQRSNQIILDEGYRRGHYIEVYHYDSDFSRISDNFDVVISSNLEIISNKYPGMIYYFTDGKKHVRLEHDMCSYLNPNVRRMLYESCHKSFFLTQYHYQQFVDKYGDYFVNVEIVPDPIDKTKFFDMGLSRSDEILYIGYAHYLKGTDNFLKYANQNPDKKFVAASWGSNEYISAMRIAPNITQRLVPFEEMPKLYNSHRQMYYNPIVQEPFCRAVGEALMCGVSIIGDSDRIGSLHMYKEDPSNFANRCHNAASTFWSIIEND